MPKLLVQYYRFNAESQQFLQLLQPTVFLWKSLGGLQFSYLLI